MAIGVAGSLAAHLVTIVALSAIARLPGPDIVGTRGVARPIVLTVAPAELAPAPEPEPTSEPEATSEPGPEPTPEPTPTPTPEPEPEPESEPEPTPEPKPEPTPKPEPQSESELLPQPADPSRPDEPPLESHDIAGAPPVATEPAAPAAPAGDDVARAAENDYRSRLRAAISRQRSYPRQARRRRQEGTVVVVFRVLADGRVDAPEVRESSGVAALDAAALAAVRGVGRFEPLPDGIGRTSLSFTVPIDFRL